MRSNGFAELKVKPSLCPCSSHVSLKFPDFFISITAADVGIELKSPVTNTASASVSVGMKSVMSFVWLHWVACHTIQCVCVCSQSKHFVFWMESSQQLLLDNNHLILVHLHILLLVVLDCGNGKFERCLVSLQSHILLLWNARIFRKCRLHSCACCYCACFINKVPCCKIVNFLNPNNIYLLSFLWSLQFALLNWILHPFHHLLECCMS